MASRICRVIAASVWAIVGGAAWPAIAGQAPPTTVAVEAGRPLRLVLARRTRVEKVGQPLDATLVEDIYACDHVAIARGTRVHGHIASLTSVSRGARAVAMLGGDLTPLRTVGVVFDRLVLAGGTTVAVQTAVTTAGTPGNRELSDIVSRPNRGSRFGHYLLGRLPVHRHYLDAGVVFNAELTAAVVLGPAELATRAPDSARPTAGSILAARLRTPLNSTTTPRGARVEAVLTQPVWSASHELVLPEGTVVTGRVTFAKPPRWFRRNGQIRLLFESVAAPGQPADAMPAALYSADVGRDQRVVVDDEGGATVSNSPLRFLAPAVAGAVAVLGVDSTEISNEGLGVLTTQSNVVGRGLKGFSGLGLVGVGLSIASRPAAIALGALGVARAVYVTLCAKGRDVVFPLHTPLQMQLSPAAPPVP